MRLSARTSETFSSRSTKSRRVRMSALDTDRNLLLIKTVIIHFIAITSRHVNGKKEIIRIQQHADRPETTFNEININKKAIKPYKLRNKFTSSKCKCEDNSRMWNCRKIQISIGRCRSDQFLCCSGF